MLFLMEEIGLLVYRDGIRIDCLNIDVHSFRLMFTAHDFMNFSQNDSIDEQFSLENAMMYSGAVLDYINLTRPTIPLVIAQASRASISLRRGKLYGHPMAEYAEKT